MPCKSSRNNWTPCKLTRSNSVVWDIRIGHHRTFLFWRNCQWWELPQLASGICWSTNYRDFGDDGDIYFQQDGAPPHYHRDVRAYLDAVFPDTWIGRRGPTEYPARSPDLTPMDFFCGGYLKDNVYGNKPRTIDALKLEIERQCRDIPNDIFRDVCESLGARYQRCLDNNGHQFEHLRTWFFNYICLMYSMLFHFAPCS